MPLSGLGRVMQVEDNRTLLYISQRVATDSAWPFRPGERVIVRIEADKQRIVVEKTPESSRRGKALLALVVLMAGALAGCIGQGQKDAGMESAETGHVVVDDTDGTSVAVNVTNGTGAVVGRVQDDAGFPVAEAHAALYGTDFSARTNSTGWFHLDRLAPKSYALRVDHPSYRATEATVEIRAGNVTRVTVTLVPPADVGAGYRPHVHDYWAGRTEVMVADRDVEFWPAQPGGPQQAALPYYQRAYQVVQSACVSGKNNEAQNGHTSAFHFDQPDQLTWPGTGTISITVSWSSTDYLGADKVGVIWHGADRSNWSWSKGLRSGETLTIPVTPIEWDVPHQMFSLWDFRLCVAGKDEGATAAGAFAGRLFLGKYHVKMVLVRGTDPPLDPPHPLFWANGTSRQILVADRTFSCPGSPTSCYAPTTAGRGTQPASFRFSASELVPPATGYLRINLSWTYSLPAFNQPLSVTYSAANVAPQQRNDVSKFEKMTPVAQTATSRSYIVALKPEQTDSFYQRISNWAFLWNVEGAESDPGYVHMCGCDLKIHLEVAAHRDGER